MNVKTIATNTNGAAEPRAKLLQGIVKRRLDVPMRVLVYGEAGIGKSTFASHAPDPIFIGSEDGTSELEVARYPVRIERWQDILDAVSALTEEEHSFRSVVLDTVDWAEPLCWAEVCRETSTPSIESTNYGKGYVRAQELWLALLRRLDTLRERRGMHVILLAHAVIRTFKNPDGDDFDMYSLKMHEKSAGVLREWSDAVLFARLERYTSRSATPGKAKAVTTGARVLHTVSGAAFFAKNRYSLPDPLPLQWEDFAGAIRAGRPEETLAKIEAMLAELVELGAVEMVAKMRAAVAKDSGDAVKLGVHMNRIAVRLHETKGKAT